MQRHEKLLCGSTAALVGLAIVLLLALLWSLSARADDTLRWQHPTQRIDETPLLLSEIQATIIVARLVGESSDPIRVIVPAPDISITIPRDVTVPGRVCYSAATMDTGGLVSGFTPEVCKSQEASPTPKTAPAPPAALTVD